jgi:hypothetical protein
MVRESVLRLVEMGPLPADQSAAVEELQERERLLKSIEKPVTDAEARELVKIFGPDDCYGLAWLMLHLIETAPGWPLTDILMPPLNEWTATLRMRAVNAGKLT